MFTVYMVLEAKHAKFNHFESIVVAHLFDAWYNRPVV